MQSEPIHGSSSQPPHSLGHEGAGNGTSESSSSKRPILSSGDEGSAPKKRSLRACQACRIAKTRCLPGRVNDVCERCASTRTTCVFPASRRGRIKGSKNIKTLEKLGIISKYGPSYEDEASSETIHLMMSGETSKTSRLSPRRNELDTETPNSPARVIAQDVVNAIESHRTSHPRDLTRKLLHIVDRQFPIIREHIEREREKNGTDEHSQDPLTTLTDMATRGWNLDEKSPPRPPIGKQLILPTISLPQEEALLRNRWDSLRLEGIMEEQRKHFEAGLYGSKRDLAKGLDPVRQGIVSESRVQVLFEAFWKHVFPQWPLLDPELHTPAFVQGRSAILFTTILALGSTAIATLPTRTDEQVTEALNLHAHVSRLNLVVYTTAARSIEIIQALILWSRWSCSPRTNVGEMRWMRAAMIPRMAQEIGLDHVKDRKGDDPQVRWNQLRTRAFLVINEYRFSTHSGRRPMDTARLELSEAEVDELVKLGPDHPMSALPASYRLFLFGRDVLNRLETIQPGAQKEIALEAELNWVKTYTERYLKEWCSNTIRPNTWHIKHDALAQQFLLTAKIVRKQGRPSENPARQADLANLAIAIFEEALKTPHIFHMTHRASILPLVAAIILKIGDRRDLILRLALRMAGDPTRAYVPTFIREAGNQMLAMLCVNRSPAEPESGQNGFADSWFQSWNHSMNTDLQTSIQSSQNNFMTQTAFDLSLMNPLQGLDHSNQTLTEPGNFFDFDGFFDFPFTPDNTLPPLTDPSTMLPPFRSADYNALTGAIPLDVQAPTMFPTMSHSDGGSMWGQLDSTDIGVQNQNIALPPLPSSPLEAVSSAQTGGSMNSLGSNFMEAMGALDGLPNDNPRRQALYQTICQLVNLATSAS